MTALQMVYVVSIAGAVLFFIAGASASSLWRARRVASEAPRDSDAELAQVRARVSELEQAAQALERARDEAARRARDNERLRHESATLATELERARGEATAELQRARGDATAAAAELERARSEATALGAELTRAQTRMRELERQLAERTHAARDLSTENEQLKGRVRDAEGLRTEYVRLRTMTTESEFLKSEIERLERELQTLRVDALGAPRARGTTEVAPVAPPTEATISDSLLGVLERFADAGTRSTTVADTIGFQMASTGSDAQALAAYATLLAESASRAARFLPFAHPISIEIVDERGVRINVWPFNVAGDRLLLARLAVTPAELGRLDPSLTALASILAPSAIAS